MDVGTNRKALQINLDAKKYGTFAEIGAGQEVARRFFTVGGAAGTIAKTMSAYDMTFSDAIYGPIATSAASVSGRCLITNTNCWSSALMPSSAAIAPFSFLPTR